VLKEIEEIEPRLNIRGVPRHRCRPSIFKQQQSGRICGSSSIGGHGASASSSVLRLRAVEGDLRAFFLAGNRQISDQSFFFFFFFFFRPELLLDLPAPPYSKRRSG